MLRSDKDTVVSEMRDRLDRAAGALFLDFTGLTVEEADNLRGKLRAADLHYQVIKNTLMTRALSETPYADASACLKGTPTGVVIGYDDPVTAAKLTFEFLKECDHIKVKGGVVDKKAISPKEAEALSKMPSKTELQGSIVALAKSPGANLMAQLKSPAGRVVGAIDALVERLEKGGEAA